MPGIASIVTVPLNSSPAQQTMQVHIDDQSNQSSTVIGLENPAGVYTGFGSGRETRLSAARALNEVPDPAELLDSNSRCADAPPAYQHRHQRIPPSAAQLGIGVTLRRSGASGPFQIQSMDPHGPAAKVTGPVAIMPGDLLYEVDDTRYRSLHSPCSGALRIRAGC